MASTGTHHLRFPLADVDNAYPPLDDAGMDSDLASDDGRSSASLAGSTYEIVSNHPDQDPDHAEESDFTAPDDTHSIDDESDISAFEVPSPRRVTVRRSADSDAILPQSPLFAETLKSPVDDTTSIGPRAAASSAFTPPSGSSASHITPSYTFPCPPLVTGTEIKLPQANSTLRLGRSLRVAYHGPDSYKDEILDKIAQAVASSLDADSKADRREDGYDHYQIISLPSTASEATLTASQGQEPMCGPEVTLVPSSGVELAVQTCDLCSDPGMEMRKATCRAPTSRSSVCPEGRLADWTTRDSSADGKRSTCKDRCHQTGFCKLHRMYEREKVDASSKPDLAIFFHPAGQYTPGSNVCSSSCSYVCSLDTSNSGVPVLDISEDARFSAIDTPVFTPSARLAAHMVEHQLVSSGSVAKPLDIHAFLALDTLNLNRHLALITSPQASILNVTWPSVAEIKSRMRASSKRLRETKAAIPGLPAYACLFSLLVAFVLVQLMRASPETLPLDLSNGTTGNIADVSVEQATKFGMPQTQSRIGSSTELGLTITTDAPVPRPRKPSRTEIGEREEVVMTLPKELATMRHPPKVFASATQEGKEVKVSIVKINGSAIKVDLEPPYSDYPVEVMVWTESKPRFKQALTCNIKQSSLQRWSASTLAKSLLGVDADKWTSLAVSELEHLWAISERWLKQALEEAKDMVAAARNQSRRAFMAARSFMLQQDPKKRKAQVARAYSGKDAACVKRLLTLEKHRSVPAAEFQCSIIRRAQELSIDWERSKEQMQSQYVSLSRKTEANYRALQERSRTSLDLWKKTSLASLELWKIQAKTIHDQSSRKVRERLVKLADKAKRRANKIRDHARKGGKGQRRRG